MQWLAGKHKLNWFVADPQTRRARIVANAHTFGCYADPLYLPYVSF